MHKKILVVDDEADYIASLKDFLRALEYDVEATMFSEHALEIIKDTHPQVVLFDYKMSDMDGDEFLAKAKRMSPTTKYILVTGYRDDAVLSKVKSLGVHEVLLKPIHLDVLLQTLTQIVQKTERKTEKK